MNEQEKILSRVRKLFRLANDAAATEGERNNALRMAHATLAKHNLSMAEAEASGEEQQEERVDLHVEARNDPWSRNVAHSIAQLFFCYYFFQPLPSTRVLHYFVGRASNAITAKEMALYVIDSINKEARKYSKETYSGSDGWRSFCKGATHRVAVRCKEIRAAAEKPVEQAAPGTGTALVLASVYEKERAANLALIEQQHGKLRDGVNRERAANWHASRAGAEFGNKINLNRQVGSSADRKALK